MEVQVFKTQCRTEREARDSAIYNEYKELMTVKGQMEKPCDFDPFGQTGLSPFGYNMIDPFGQNSIDHLAHLLL